MADGRTLNIEDVKLGDKVVNRLGKPDEVITTYCRPYAGPGIRLDIRGMLDKVTCTANHNFWVIPREQVRCDIDKSNHYSPEWRAAEAINSGDYVLTPIPDRGIDMNARWIITIKRDLVPDNSIYTFAAPKFIGNSPPEQNKQWSFVWNGFLARPVQNVEELELQEDVYNLEIQDDHSYTVADVTVKNCNRNGDGWSGTNPVSETIPPFRSTPRCYRDHINKDSGQVLWCHQARHLVTDPMHRIELVLGYNETKAAADAMA